MKTIRSTYSRGHCHLPIFPLFCLTKLPWLCLVVWHLWVNISFQVQPQILDLIVVWIRIRPPQSQVKVLLKSAAKIFFVVFFFFEGFLQILLHSFYLLLSKLSRAFCSEAWGCHKPPLYKTQQPIQHWPVTGSPFLALTVRLIFSDNHSMTEGELQ